jgi:NAD+ kinase
VCDVTRTVLVVAHTGRAVISDAARRAIHRLQDAGVRVRALGDEVSDLGLTGIELSDGEAGSAAGAELVLVLGGDGSILRAAELARAASVPLLGVNLGRVGFLAEVESEDLDRTLDRVLDQDYTVEERMTLDVTLRVDGAVAHTGWALNECSVEKAARERMLELVVEVDGRPLSRWGCDGVVAATPTGSTAYAFSAGGPVVWPTVEALLVVPISAHALFARPLVAAPSSVIALEVLPSGTTAVLACDGRRTVTVPHGARVEVRRGSDPVLLARTQDKPFTDTLVRKFALPVEGWRGARERSVGDLPETVAGPT